MTGTNNIFDFPTQAMIEWSKFSIVLCTDIVCANQNFVVSCTDMIAINDKFGWFLHLYEGQLWSFAWNLHGYISE